MLLALVLVSSSLAAQENDAAQIDHLTLLMEKCQEYTKYKDHKDYKYVPGVVMVAANPNLPREEIDKIAGSNGLQVRMVAPYPKVQMVVMTVPKGEEKQWADRLKSYATIKCTFLNTTNTPVGD